MEPAPNQPEQPAQPAKTNRAERAPWEAATQRPPAAPPGYGPVAPGYPAGPAQPQAHYAAPHAPQHGARPMPQPQGYAQPPMPGPQGYAQPPMPGQPYPYAMQAPYPMPYPPRKSGFPTWAIVLICAVVGLPILMILLLAAIPLFTSNSSEARRIEAESMLGTLKGEARVAFAKSGFPPTSLTAPYEGGGAGVPFAELQGKYFNVDDEIGMGGPGYGDSGILTAHGINVADGTCTHKFRWEGGNGTFSWK